MWYWVFYHLKLMQTLTNSETKQEILWGFGLYWLWFIYLFVCFFTYKHLKWTLFSLSKRGNLLEGCWSCLRESKEMLNNQDRRIQGSLVPGNLSWPFSLEGCHNDSTPQLPFSSGIHSKSHVSIKENLIGPACVRLSCLCWRRVTTHTGSPEFLRAMDTLCIRPSPQEKWFKVAKGPSL